MKSYDEFSEDLETRRQLLKQRQTDQAASFKQKGAANLDAQKNRMDAAKQKQADVQARIDDTKERAREAEMARKEAEKEREAENQERQDLKDQEITQSKEDKKSLAYAQAITQSELLSSGAKDLKDQEKINGNIPTNLFLINNSDSFDLGYLIACLLYTSPSPRDRG